MKILMVAWVPFSGGMPILFQDGMRARGHNVRLIGLDSDVSPFIALLHDNYRGNAWERSWLEKYLLNRYVMQQVRRLRPEVFLIHGSNWVLFAATLKKIRSLGITIALREGNLALFSPERMACLQHYDIIFAGDSYLVPLLERAMGKSHVHYIHGVAAPDIFYPHDFKPGEKDAFAAEVSFFGSAYPGRVRFFEQLAGLGISFKLWGRGWHRADKLAPFCQPKEVGPIHKARVYGATTINLDFHAGHQQINAISARAFEVLCCGGFVLAEYRTDIEYFFDIGKDLDVFHTPQEAAKKIRYYLNHPTERAAMAERGRQKAVQQWSIGHATERMLEAVEKHRHSRQ